MNQFQDEMRALEASRCSTCGGIGECDDAELGDISFRTWKCVACGGTGKKREPVSHDAEGPLYKSDLDADALRDGTLKRRAKT